MKKNEVLLLIGNNSENIFESDWENNGYKYSYIFKDIPKPLRLIRRIITKYNLSLNSMWLSDWFNNLEEYKSVIIHMSRLTRYLPGMINKKYPDLKIICWYWNTIDENTIPVKYDNPNIEYWTFDENDCKKYNFRKNIQYYCAPSSKDAKKEYDVYFIGRDKGRRNTIENVKEMLEEKGISTHFNIIDDDSKLLTYKEVKNELLKTKAVLDINKDQQVGYTLRVLESLFFSIKLITNNPLIKESDFYSSQNIFILETDDENKLYDFINSEYDHSVDIYREKYEINTWFDNFYKE